MQAWSAGPIWHRRSVARPHHAPMMHALCQLGLCMQVGAIHAGLECGIILEKVPGMDAVSYGPTIKGAHSPDERVEIATVAPFWEATLKILGRLAARQ